jgi:hypothetical protein
VRPQRREVASEGVTGAWGRAGPRLYAGRAGKPAAGHRARLTTLGICCTAPKSRSKATIRGQNPEWLECTGSVSSTPRTGPHFGIAANSPYVPCADVSRCENMNIRVFGRLSRYSLVQLAKQRFGILEVKRVMALGEPAVDWSEQMARLVPLAPITPEPR